VVGAGVVIRLERGADLHMAQLMPLPLTVSCFSKIQIGFTFLVPTHTGCSEQRTGVCVFTAQYTEFRTEAAEELVRRMTTQPTATTRGNDDKVLTGFASHA